MMRYSVSMVTVVVLVLGFSPSAQAVVITFQDGVNPTSSYAGTQDTHIRQVAPTTPVGTTATTVVADQEDGGTGNGFLTQGLIRFDNLFGMGPNQIPVGATINSATLRLNTADPSVTLSMSLHDMLQTWSESSVFNDFSAGGAGIQTNNVEAKSSATVGPFDTTTNGEFNYDVTASLQAWVTNPSQNFGWVVIPGSTNGWQFTSREGAIANRPELIVDYFFAVPEPSSMALFVLLGMVGVAAAGWCGRRKSASR